MSTYMGTKMHIKTKALSIKSVLICVGNNCAWRKRVPKKIAKKNNKLNRSLNKKSMNPKPAVIIRN